MKLFKVCPDCKLDQPVTAFGANAKLRDGLQFYCRACSARRGAEVYRRRRAKLGKSVRERVAVPVGHKRCPGCREIKPHSEWHLNATSSDGLAARCKECRRVEGRIGHLKRSFGLTTGDVESLIASQGGGCGICVTGKPQHVDHDHVTGLVRGVLCGPCNMGLGQFADDPHRLDAAAGYLRRRRDAVTFTVTEVDLRDLGFVIEVDPACLHAA